MSGTDRASLSSLVAVNVSPSRTAARAWSRPGRAWQVRSRPSRGSPRSPGTPSAARAWHWTVRSWARVEHLALFLLSCRVAPERSGERTYGAVPSTCLLLVAALQRTPYGPSARDHDRCPETIAAAQGEHQRTTESPPATSATLRTNGTKVAPRPGAATSSPTGPGQPCPLTFSASATAAWPGLQVPPRGLADCGQATGDDLLPGPTCRARHYRAVPGRLRGQATGLGDGRQARRQVPDPVS